MTTLEKDNAYVWHPFTQSQTANNPIPIVKGKGAWVWDENGNKYIDGNSAWWTIIHGHGNEYIAKKINEQFLKSTERKKSECVTDLQKIRLLKNTAFSSYLTSL